MATKALTGLVAAWFTPSDQVGEDVEDPTRYYIKPLDGLQFMEVAANGDILKDGSFIPSHTGRMLLLRHGLKGWENVLEPDGKPLEFNLARIKFLNANHLIELTNEILERSSLGAEDQKN